VHETKPAAHQKPDLKDILQWLPSLPDKIDLHQYRLAFGIQNLRGKYPRAEQFGA